MENKRIGLDVGFGWTKYVVGDKQVKFPTWIGLWTGYAVSDVKPIKYEGREYVVGYPARFSKQRIEIVDFNDILRWTGLIVQYVKSLEGDLQVIGGLSPKHYARYLKEEESKRVFDNYYSLVLPQGFGALLDVEDKLNLKSGEQVFVLDVGYNTVDYLIVLWDGSRYERIGMDTIEGMGVQGAVEVFKKSLPTDLVGLASGWSKSRLISVFESGVIKVEGEEVDLSVYKERAISAYTDMLISRLKEEVGEGLFEADKVVLCGGGAYFLKDIRKDAIVPKDPEFSNARGYQKVAY